jgi:hypothetical protein
MRWDMPTEIETAEALDENPVPEMIVYHRRRRSRWAS